MYYYYFYPLNNVLEIHYSFVDEGHYMDAIVENKCEHEILGIIKSVASFCNVEITVETEALGEGGLRKWLKIISKNENKAAVVSTALIVSILTTLIITPIQSSISTIIEESIKQLYEDKSKEALEKEKLLLDVENAKLDIELKREQLNQNKAIVKKRSNFYQFLDSYPRITKVGVQIQNFNHVPVSEEFTVTKDNFRSFIVEHNEIHPIIVNDAIIEIVSPVLKKGDYKWRGIYNGEILSFNMKSAEFKSLVQAQQIEFKNGSSIKCQLEIERRLNSEGNEEICGYSITRVDEYFQNSTPIETPEGKKHRQKIEAERQQLNIPFSDPDK